MKRAFDVVVSIALLLLAAPVLLPVMLIVFLQDFRSPFYLGVRAGRNEVPFRMVKLRSMQVNADRSGVDSTSGDDRRITPVGRFIRAYKLDELMQLWNVLVGDMSLVGPRPCLPYEWEIYKDWHKKRTAVRPGITGLWQVVGRSEVSFEDMILLDLYYIYNYRLELDFSILFETIFVVLKKKGAH